MRTVPVLIGLLVVVSAFAEDDTPTPPDTTKTSFVGVRWARTAPDQDAGTIREVAKWAAGLDGGVRAGWSF